MDFEGLMHDATVQKVAVAVASAVSTWLFTNWRNKTTTLDYTASVERVGLTTEDPIFGNVEVRWQQQPIPNLFFATLRVSNPSLKDIEKLKIAAYPSEGVRLLNEQTHIDESVHTVPWDPEWFKELSIPEGQQATEQQWRRWYSGREYLLDVFNRGETLTFTYLLTNEKGAEPPPMVYLEVRKAGVRAVLRPHLTSSFGVPTRIALTSGLFLTGLVIVLVVSFSLNIWLVALVPAIVGLGAQWFGAAAYRGWLFLKRVLAG